MKHSKPFICPSRNFPSAHSSNVSASIGGSSISSVMDGSRTPNLSPNTPSTHIPNDSAKSSSPSAFSRRAAATIAVSKPSAEAFSKANCADAKFTLGALPCNPNANTFQSKRRAEVLALPPGVGPVTIAGLIIDMPELGGLDAKAAASLAGLVPMAHESENWKGRSHIKGGRSRVRRLLYMAALSAIRCIPDLAAKCRQLLGDGRFSGHHAQAAPAGQRPAPRRPALDAAD